MPDLRSKDEALQQVVNRLEAGLGAGSFVVVDHWEADERAVGIAKPDDHHVLVHIAVDPATPDRYFVELELPPRGCNDLPYTPAGTFDELEFKDLLDVVAEHLQADPR